MCASLEKQKRVHLLECRLRVLFVFVFYGAVRSGGGAFISILHSSKWCCDLCVCVCASIRSNPSKDHSKNVRVIGCRNRLGGNLGRPATDNTTRWPSG